MRPHSVLPETTSRSRSSAAPRATSADFFSLLPGPRGSSGLPARRYIRAAASDLVVALQYCITRRSSRQRHRGWSRLHGARPILPLSGQKPQPDGTTGESERAKPRELPESPSARPRWLVGAASYPVLHGPVVVPLRGPCLLYTSDAAD